MGYTTEFTGQFVCSKALTPAQITYLNAFSRTRRMDRDENKTALRPDPIREAVGLPLPVGGGYFVGERGYGGQDRGPDVVNGNRPPHLQPGLWCKWVPTRDGEGIEWDGGEKFDAYEEWLNYLICHFLAPWGIQLSGQVSWQGEEHDDNGVLIAGPCGVRRGPLDDLPVAGVGEKESAEEPLQLFHLVSVDLGEGARIVEATMSLERAIHKYTELVENYEGADMVVSMKSRELVV